MHGKQSGGCQPSYPAPLDGTQILSRIVFRMHQLKKPLWILRLSKTYLRQIRRRFSAFFISDRSYIERQYQRSFGISPNLDNPTTFNEKLQWLKLHSRDPLLPICADKWRVRDFVSERVGARYLNELYKSYDDVKDISFSDLPDQFVLKVNHGSGQNILVSDKKKLNESRCNAKLRQFLSANHYYGGREWAYKNIHPKIICERLMSINGLAPDDYKFFCFQGVPRLIQVDVDRFGTHARDMFDTDWNLIPVEYVHSNSARPVGKPVNLNEMLDVSRSLADGFPFVRVDLYAYERQIIFGEMTFYPENAVGNFRPNSFDRKLGDWLDITQLSWQLASDNT